MGTGKQIGYIRVSSADQNTERQLDGVTLDRIFEDRLSGAKADNRPQLQACLDYIRDGDTLHVHSIDRLARNLFDLERLVETLTTEGIAIRFHKEGLTFSADVTDPFQTLMRQVIGAVAQFEREMIRARQREGIAAAKAAGKRFGRPRALTSGQIDEIRARRAAGESPSALAREYGIGRTTLYSVLSSEQFQGLSS